MSDIWTWSVIYRTGARFQEHDERGDPRGFAQGMAEGEVAAVELRWSERPDLPPIRVQIPDDVRPIFFRRRTQTLNAATGEHLGTETIHVLGWQKTLSVGGVERNVKSFVWIHPDGSVVLTDRDLDD